MTTTTNTGTTTDTRALTMEFDFPHPPAKVWRALTEPELVSKWLMKTDMKLAVGQPFTFKMQPQGGWDGVIDCEMKEIEPQKRLRYSWTSMGMTTVVTWTLAEAKGGTRVQLEQAGFPVAESANRFVEGARMGWQSMAGQRLPEVLGQL
ncbi:MAG: SRPBCC family protein [Polyangiaceae bacterium]